MSRSDYEFAELAPDVVEEIRVAERKLSELSGQPITLIAYRSDAGTSKMEHPSDVSE